MKSSSLNVIAADCKSCLDAQENSFEAMRRMFDVQYVVRGAVTCTSSGVQVTASLIRTEDNVQEWSNVFEGTLDDPLALQAEVAEAVANSLPLALSGDEIRTLRTPTTTVGAAEVEYIKGRFWWNKRNETSLERALEHFDAAILLDPLFARAYAGKADTLSIQALTMSRAPHDVIPLARAAARKALALDESLAEAHTAI